MLHTEMGKDVGRKWQRVRFCWQVDSASIPNYYISDASCSLHATVRS